jgi:hypothetical protein
MGAKIGKESKALEGSPFKKKGGAKIRQRGKPNFGVKAR